ncbi:hypothetical protein IWQ61_000960 [Dispira simplex]|nr:hypothetical protein IWQ61_000960 [Dispira simplex]
MAKSSSQPSHTRACQPNEERMESAMDVSAALTTVAYPDQQASDPSNQSTSTDTPDPPYKKRRYYRRAKSDPNAPKPHLNM